MKTWFLTELLSTLSFCVAVLKPQISLKDKVSLGKDSDVTMEIPVHTTIAYALTELEIEHDGRYGENSFIT